jgi:hypothetical protein
MRGPPKEEMRPRRQNAAAARGDRSGPFVGALAFGIGDRFGYFDFRHRSAQIAGMLFLKGEFLGQFKPGFMHRGRARKKPIVNPGERRIGEPAQRSFAQCFETGCSSRGHVFTQKTGLSCLPRAEKGAMINPSWKSARAGFGESILVIALTIYRKATRRARLSLGAEYRHSASSSPRERRDVGQGLRRGFRDADLANCRTLCAGCERASSFRRLLSVTN